MTLALSTHIRAKMLNAITASMADGGGNPTLTLYQTNLALCEFSLTAVTPFGSTTTSALVMADAPLSAAGLASGNANRFVLIDSASNLEIYGTVSGLGGGGDIETPSLAVTIVLTQVLNSFVIRLSSTGALSIEASLALQ